MNYKEYNDYELVYQINDGDEVAYNVLISKYKNLIGKLAKKYYEANKNIGIEYDDLFQEGMVALSSALKDYDQDNTLFYTFLILIVRREMERLIKTAKRFKHMILNESLSLNELIIGSEDIYLEDIIPSDYNLENYYYSKEVALKLYYYKYNLKDDEALVYELKFNNFSISEISNLLDIPYKKVDNYLHKIRKSLSQYVLTFK